MFSFSKLIEMDSPICGEDAVMDSETVDVVFVDGKVFGEIDSQQLRDSGNYFAANEWMRMIVQRLLAILPRRAENMWVEMMTDEKVDEYLRLVNPLVA